MRVPVWVVLRSDINNSFCGLFTTLQDAKDAVIKQYKQIGVVTFSSVGSKQVNGTITNSANTIIIKEQLPHSQPEGLEGF